jgi:hypothetical protein
VRKKYNYLLLGIFAVLSAFIAVSCSALSGASKGGGPEAQTVVGNVLAVRDGDTLAVDRGFRFGPQDEVAVPRTSKLKVGVAPDAPRSRIGARPSSFFVNEGSLFTVMPSAEAEKGAIAVKRGEYYFAVRDEGKLTVWFGDIAVSMENTDAALAINAPGRMAVFFVIGGQAVIRRGDEVETLTDCQAVVFDAAGISEDAGVTAMRGTIITRLKSWVGEEAVMTENCSPPPAGAAMVRYADGSQLSYDETSVAQPLAPIAIMRQTTRPSRAESEVALETVQRPETRVGGPRIENIMGPRRIHAGEEFALRCSLSGPVTPVGYVWLFNRDGKVTEHRTTEPRIVITLEEPGEVVVTCAALAEGDVVLTSLQARLRILTGQIAISAGGPYSAVRGRPVRMLGNARSRFSDIVLYEWYVSGNPDEPDFSFEENAIIEHTFMASGEYWAIYRVTLADGSSAIDTAIVNVVVLPPTANAGPDIVSSPGRRVRLNGTGSTVGGEIVKYEWDLDGSGKFGWSSEKSGNVSHIFGQYSFPVLRVTDSEGLTATDTMRVVICPRDMVTVAGKLLCVDKYEWPNRRGTVPTVNVTYYEAAAACDSLGKRLCTASEWRRACRNDSDLRLVDGRSYPYGDAFSARACNTLDNPRSRNTLSPAGLFGDCAGRLSIFDMSGNAAEWVASDNSATAPAYGGFYQSGEDGSDCDSFITLNKDRGYFYVGFRCCK